MAKAEERTATRDRLVEVAMELFYRQGYHATGIADILRQAEARSGSLYYFFKSKEDLLLAVLDRYLELLWPMVMTPLFAKTDDPIDRVFAVLDGYRTWILDTEFTYNCPIGSLALEVGAAMPAAREKIAQNFEGWIGAIRQCLDAAADRLPADADRDGLARFVLTVMEGGVMQARANRSIAPFDASVAQLRDYFRRLLAEGRTRRRKRSAHKHKHAHT